MQVELYYVFCKLVVYAQETGVLFPCFSVAKFFWSMRLYFKTAYYKTVEGPGGRWKFIAYFKI